LLRRRQIIWLLSTLLTLGTLQAMPVSRCTPFAQIRSSACLVLADLLRQESPERERSEAGYPKRDYPARPTTAKIEYRRLTNPWLGSHFRFQRPPPVFAI
jgi:hypothetical protein